jgi:hypothetical protein
MRGEMKTIDFLFWTDFKSLSQIKGNSVTDYGYLNFIVYVRRGHFGYWPRTSENLAVPLSLLSVTNREAVSSTGHWERQVVEKRPRPI